MFVDVNRVEDAKFVCPWAVAIIEVEGGYYAFRTWDEVSVWENNIGEPIEAL